MSLTLAQRFGTNAVVDDSVPTAPKLIIELTDLQPSPNGDIQNRGIDDATLISSTNGNDYADKIFTALFILSKQKQPPEDNDETVGFYINDPFKSITTRNNISQIQFNYAVNFYIPDTTSELDADSVV
jgi:hypothetical protein